MIGIGLLGTLGVVVLPSSGATPVLGGLTDDSGNFLTDDAGNILTS